MKEAVNVIVYILKTFNERKSQVYGGKNEETYFNRRIRANREFTGFVYQKGHPSSEIIGFDNQAEATEFAKKTGLIDEIAESLTSGQDEQRLFFLFPS